MIKRAALILLLAVSADRGPETVKIDVNRAKLAVKAFPHHRHQEMRPLKGKCTFCHHDAREGQKPQKCGACHKLVKKKDPETGAVGFKKAFHKRCLACHKKQADRPRLAKCKTCHPKK
jgi:hypothetical protein